jgi:uncharacterized protein
MRALLPAQFARTMLALSLLLPTACTADTTSTPATKTATKPATATSTAPATRVLESPPYRVDFDSTTMAIKGRQFTVEIANTPIQTERGLMYRDSMPADHGMLFIMPTLAKTSFWMKNTRIPLDIIFLDQTGKVVEIANAKTFDETGVGPNVPVRYVIELNAGTSEKIGLKKGDMVTIPAQYARD